MKTIMLAFMLVASVSLFQQSAVAQQKKTMSAQELTQTLSNFNSQTGLINVGNISVPVSNVTVQDLITVQNVLNNAQIDVLNNSLNNLNLDLSNLLRDAKILNKNQVVVGILSDQGALRLVTQNVRTAK